MRLYFERIKRYVHDFIAAPRLLSRIFKAGVFLLTAVITLAFVFYIMVWMGAFGQIPSKKDLEKIHHPIASEVYSADSVLLGRYYFQERSPATKDEISESLKHALIATEDVRFYEHNGIDYRSMFRVLIKSILLQDDGSGGGSTLTQQLAKNLYPRKKYSILSLPVNKVKEFILARRIERIYSKDEILLLYLNTIPFSDNTYGVKTAAERFFSKKVQDLSVDQAALLVGMLKATHSYNPRLFPERALQRRNVVLAQMEKYGFISNDEKKQYQKKTLALQYNTSTSANTGLASYFRTFIQKELVDWCSKNKKADGSSYNLYTDGLKIYTTIDSRLQQYAEESMRSHMKLLQARFEKQLSKQDVDRLAKAELKRLPKYQKLKEKGLDEKEIVKELSSPVNTKVFDWEGDQEAKLNALDSLKHYLQFLQTGMMAVQPGTGHIKIWIGGIDHRYFKYDHVKESTKRQVGSTIKPLLYAAAIERGINPCSYISARKTSYTNMEGWTPENTEDETYEMKYSMEGGLAGSVNTVSVKLLEKTGIDNAIAMVRRMGIKSSLQAVPSLALGTPSISVMEMVGAYSVLANDGEYVEPNYLLSITDHSGELLERFVPARKPQKALSAETTRLMVQMLRSVVSAGTASSLRTRYGITNDIVGKTGTTQSNVDGWFMAVMPELVIGTWVGADNPQLHFKNTSEGQGAVTALPIVAGLIQRANKDPRLESVMKAKFESLSENELDQLDCDRSKSNKNIFERIFKKKKGVKVTKFKDRKGKRS